MARKIRFPLKMKNGAEVRTLEELRENFDLESVLGYFTDGKLVTWLADRYYDEKAEAVSALSADTPDLNAKLCEIFGVEYKAETDETNLEDIQRRNEKYRMLNLVTDNQDALNNIEFVATNQDELFDILDQRPETVYLYGERYSIPLGMKKICYIGLNQPLVLLEKNKNYSDYKEAGIEFVSVKFEDGVKPVETNDAPNLPPIGEILKFGKYEWYVIGIEGDCCMLLMKGFIPDIPYHNKDTEITWENCSLRKWLNTSFYNQFSDEEKNKIIKRHCPSCNNDLSELYKNVVTQIIWFGDSEPSNIIDAGNPTDDYVYILSIDEVKDIDKNILIAPECPSWWLRCPGESKSNAALINYDGTLDRKGFFVIFEQIGVRPAITIKY